LLHVFADLTACVDARMSHFLLQGFADLTACVGVCMLHFLLQGFAGLTACEWLRRALDHNAGLMNRQ